MTGAATNATNATNGLNARNAMNGPDVAVVGDGPAGTALAAACADVGLSVQLHGPGEPWRATYATWRDDVEMLPDDVFGTVSPAVDVVGRRRHRIRRAYGVFDNDALRAHLLAGLPSGAVQAGRVDPDAIRARLVVDARGADPAVATAAWQTAFGVVLDTVPNTLDLAADIPTLMDWRPAAGDAPPSFCYVVPVGDGWLVEETVLAAVDEVDPAVLRSRLERRLGSDGPTLVAGAVRAEEVRIPMGLPPRRTVGVHLAFGAAAGYVHPATGYSVAAALRAAPRVARAIADGRDPAEAIWPRPHRRARALHDYGLAALLRLDAHDTASFFDAFFELPVERWAGYLRVDTTPAAVAGVMGRVFRRAPWRVRRRLVTVDPRVLRRLVAAS